MSAYLVFNYKITNPEGYEPYPAAAVASLENYNAEVLVADFESEHVEGDGEHVTVVVRFKDKDAARAWHESDEYRAIVDQRLENAETLVGALVDGTD